MKKMPILSKQSSILGPVVLLLCTLLPISTFAFENTFTNAQKMEFVLVHPGTFTMGSPLDETNRGSSEIQHLVTISKPFYMQTTEVTLEQWRSLMGKKLVGSRKGLDNSPVTQVSWFDCMKFIERINQFGEGKYRLPTEAEWEYAARAGTNTAFCWGDTIDCNKAMHGNKSMKHDVCQLYIKSLKLNLDQAAPVKSYAPNAWGLYDMHGNVWEWVMDWYGDYGTKSVTDPRGPKSGKMRVRRGGSWFGQGHLCRSANRAMGHPATRYRTTGFRLVREIQ
jgi:formylglycine-generating enzyme required for sulfatase activity